MILCFQVIPLSQRSGLVEWCEGTISIGDYLVGATSASNEGAHCRYNPRDWSNGECKRRMMEVSTFRSTQTLLWYALYRLLRQKRE